MANNDPWVDDRLNALTPPAEWQPDAERAIGRVKERDMAYRKRRAQWMGSAMAASVLALAILLTPAKCAFGVCHTPVMPPDEPAPPALASEAQGQVRPALPAPMTAKPQAPHKSAPVKAAEPPRNFKESGNPDAPITCEIFTDYQCVHCATIFDQSVPGLIAEYVQTGRMKLVHRDFPLPSHAYAKLAARYANAAGQVGQYELIVNQIFRTQAAWAQNGDVDTQVAQVVSPDVMEKIRDQVKNDERLDATMIGDMAIARQDNLTMTPSLVVTYKGKRQVLAPVPPYNLLKSYLDELLTK
jgi:protein-disulfide isomerase